MPHLKEYTSEVPSKKTKDYGKCGFFRHHKVEPNKNGQYTCKYCGKTKFTLEKELAFKEKSTKRR